MASLFAAIGTAAASAGSAISGAVGSAGSLMSAASLASTVIGTGLSVAGAVSQADAAKKQAAWQAAQLEKQGNEARAVGQKRMFERRRQTGLVQSRLNAVAAAGGGDTTDPTIENLGSGIAERGEYAALTEFYNGENRARGYEDAAAASIYKGKVASQAGYMKAAGSIFDGIGTFGKQYKTYYG